MVQTTHSSSRRLEFNSQHSHGGSQPSVVPVPGDPMSLAALSDVVHRRVCRQNTHTPTTDDCKCKSNNLQCWDSRLMSDATRLSVVKPIT